MAMSKGHEFRVVLEGIELDPKAAESIGRAVQKAAMSELVRLDLGGVFQLELSDIFDGRTRGLILRRASE